MTNNRKKRLFIAFNLPDSISNYINSIIVKLKNHKNVSWTKKDNLHITLHFLGYLSEDEENKVKLLMQGLIGKFKKIELTLDKISAFPNLTIPKIIFVSCRQKNGNSSFNLQKILKNELTNVGIKTDNRNWTSHITIGRIKFGNINLELSPEINHKDHFVINTFDLMSSELKPTGAEYKIIEKYNLLD